MESESKSNPPAASPPFLVNEREAARLLGLSQRTLWSMRVEGVIPFARMRNRIGYRIEDLREFVAKSLRHPKPPNDRRAA